MSGSTRAKALGLAAAVCLYWARPGCSEEARIGSIDFADLTTLAENDHRIVFRESR